MEYDFQAIPNEVMENQPFYTRSNEPKLFLPGIEPKNDIDSIPMR